MIVRTQFLRAALENRCEILTYGFAPDGARLLIHADESAVQAFRHASRSYAARLFRIRTGRRLWDAGTTEAIVRDAQDAHASAQSVLSAPISGSFAWDRLAAINLQSQIINLQFR